MTQRGEPSTSSDDQPAPGPSAISPQAVHRFRQDLTRGEDVIDPSTWAGSVPSQTGIAPRIRIGRDGWFNLLWLLPIGFAVAIAPSPPPRACARCRSSSASSRATRARPSPPPTDGDAGFPWWINAPALLQPVPDDVHHPLRHPDPVRPPAPVLDPPQHPGQGVVPRPETGPRRSALDGQAGLDQPPRARGTARHPPFHRARPLVAPRRRHALPGQWSRLLRPAVRHVAVASARPDDLGGVPERAVDR